MDLCEFPRCRAGADITYLGRGVCEYHWNKLTADDAPPDRLRMALGIPAEQEAAMEDSTMVDDGKKNTRAADAGEAPAKATKAAKAPKKAKSAKPAKADKPKREMVANPVVFAFRLSESDRKRIHDAAGGGKASQFVLAAALAAANGDVDAFRRVVEARASK